MRFSKSRVAWDSLLGLRPVLGLLVIPSLGKSLGILAAIARAANRIPARIAPVAGEASREFTPGPSPCCGPRG